MKITSVAKALLIDADNQMLVLRRSETHPTLAGQSDLPGGVIDRGEEPGEALIREIYEETGLSVDFFALKLVYSGTEFYKSSYIRMLYVVRLDTSAPKVRLSFEHDQTKWLPISELAKIEKDYIPFYANAFDYLIKHQILETLIS